MLLQDAVVVNVPAGAVEEVQIVRNLDEPNARFDQPPREQAPLAEFAAVSVAQLPGSWSSSKIRLNCGPERRSASPIVASYCLTSESSLWRAK